MIPVPMRDPIVRLAVVGAIATFMLLSLAMSLSGGRQGSMAAQERHQQAMRDRVAAQEARMTNGTIYSEVSWRAPQPQYEAVSAWTPPASPSRDWRDDYEEVRSVQDPGPRLVFDGDMRSDEREAWRERQEERSRQHEADRLARQLDARLYGR